jgi:hypothetical protein
MILIIKVSSCVLYRVSIYLYTIFLAWKTGHIYNANYLFQLTTSDLTEEQTAVPPGNIVIEWKRSGDQNDQYYKSVLSLPSIQFQQQGLVVLAGNL